jgi:hypothetical protein
MEQVAKLDLEFEEVPVVPVIDVEAKPLEE